MNKNLIRFVVALLLGWATLSLVGCHADPKPSKEDPSKEGEHEGGGEQPDTIPDTVKVMPQAFFMPLLRFGEQVSPTELDEWSKLVGATLTASDAETRRYALPTDTLEAMILQTPRGIYREMTLIVPQHPFGAERSFLSFLRREGFQQSQLYPYLWFDQKRGLWMEYYADETAREDIHYYAGAVLTDFSLAFTQLCKDVSRREVREQLATQGYQYNKEASDLYKLVFDQAESDWPRVVVYYDKSNEQPAQVQMLARDRYVLHSPTIQKRLEEQGFYVNTKRHSYEAFSYIHDDMELQVDLYMSDTPTQGKMPGGLIISYHVNPNAPVQMDHIDFPSFNWGATQEELEAFEKERGRASQMFMGVLNVPTGDPNFPRHAYYFDGNGKYIFSETQVSRPAVVKDKVFVQLMREAGFDFDSEQDGKIKYFNDFQHIVAIIDLTAPSLGITYRPLGG